MFLWLIFVIVSFFLGLSISFLLNYKFYNSERIFFSFVVGHSITIWIAFLLSYIKASLSIDVIILCILICALASFILIAKAKKAGKGFFTLNKLLISIRHWDKYTFSFFSFLFLYLSIMNLYGVFRPDEAGNLHAFLTVWGDYPFHTSLITSFVYNTNFSFPLSYPQFLHAEMHYPFLFDFYSAILMKGGLNLRNSIIIPNILFQLSLFGLFFYLAYRLTGLKKVGILSVIIFIFSGFPKLSEFKSLGIHFLNPIYAVIMPQRTAILGLGISFAVYILLFHAFMEEEGKKEDSAIKELILAGTLIGFLPYIHPHSFMVTAFVAFFLSSFAVIKKRERDLKVFIFLFLPLILLSFPQILCIKSQVSENFLVFFPGWTEENRNMIMGFDWATIPAFFFSIARTIFVFLKFWLLNLGALFFLLPLGFLIASKNLKIFYLPFFFLFFIANIIKFQPWWFDNYKIFIHWLVFSSILACIAIFGGINVVKRRKRDKRLYTLLFASLIVICTFFGFLTHVGMMTKDYRIWSAEDIKIAEWVRENTPGESIFLTGSAHNHPILALSGRQIVMGYEGWLWSHGINWTRIIERKNDVIAMYKGNYTLTKEYGVDYVCVSPYEESFAIDNHFDINYSAFSDETRFYLKYDAVMDGERWRIYEVKMPNIPA